MIIGLFLYGNIDSIYINAITMLIGYGSSFSFIGLLLIAAVWFDVTVYPKMVGLCQFCSCAGFLLGQTLSSCS